MFPASISGLILSWFLVTGKIKLGDGSNRVLKENTREFLFYVENGTIH